MSDLRARKRAVVTSPGAIEVPIVVTIRRWVALIDGGSSCRAFWDTCHAPHPVSSPRIGRGGRALAKAASLSED